MIRVERTVTVDRPLDAVAHYLSDFRTTAQWDPHTAECTREDSGDLGVGSTFVNTQKFGPVKPKYTYRVSTFEPGRSITLKSNSGSVDLTDTMLFAGGDAQSTVEYIAEFRFKGVGRLAEPFFKPLLNKLADDGARGMREALERLPASR